MSKKAITFTSDSKYMHYTLNLLNSIEKNCKDIDVYYRGVNISEDDEFSIMDYDINYVIDRVDLPTKRNLVKNRENQLIVKDRPIISQILYSEVIAYTCHSRFKNISYLLKEGYDTILALDADSYINKNIDKLFRDYKHFDICSLPVDNEFFRNEGLLLINNSKKVLKFFKEVEKYLFKQGHYKEWDSDGYILTKLQETYNLKLGPLSPLFKSKPNDKAYIWSGDGVIKHETSIIK